MGKKSVSSFFYFSICFNNNNSSRMLFTICFSGTTHLGNKNKGREADTIEKQKQEKRAGKKECLMIFIE